MGDLCQPDNDQAPPDQNIRCPKSHFISHTRLFLHGLLYILPYLYGLDKYNSISLQQKTAYRKLPHSDTRSFSVCRGEYCICLINKLSLFQIIKINMLHSLIIQSDVVGDTCDVLAVRRSCPSGGYRIAKIFSNVSTFPLDQDTSMAFLIARSTF